MSRTHPNRNDPCPCGSGLKYKHCCAGKQRIVVGRILGLPYWVAGLIAVVFIALGVFLIRETTRPPAESRAGAELAPGGAGPPPGVNPAWYYDSLNQRHWDPNHGHWHDGPPPPSAGGTPPSAPAAGATLPPTPAAAPQPWQYDSVTNRYWDPTHGHWHDGPPPNRP